MNQRARQLLDWLRSGSTLWFFAILAGLGWHKIGYSLAKKGFSIDGSYYVSVATFVERGLGLKTNVSLYHQAFSYFPHETPVSPLWPLLLGYTAKIWPLESVAIWLPTLLYFTTLAGAYLWGSRLMPRDFFPNTAPGFNAGHLAMLVFGLHNDFFEVTSMPYTEGLAFTLLFFGMWRIHGHLRDITPWGAVEMGIWLGVLLLARAQLAIVAIAVVLALGWKLATQPARNNVLALFVTPGIFAAIVGGYYLLFLQDFVGNSFTAAVMRFDQAWETDVLSKFAPMVETDSLEDYIKDRAEGFPVAFKESGRFAYARTFYMFQWAIPLALAVLLVHALRNLRGLRERLPGLVAWLRSGESAPWVFAVLLGLGGWLSIHTIHKDYFSEWHFARRHALTAGLAFFLAMAYLLHRPRLGRVIGVVLLCGSLVLGVHKLDKSTRSAERSEKHSPYDRNKGLVKWLQKEDARDEDQLIVAMTAQEPQRMSFITPEIGYHWVYDKTTFADIETLTQKLGVDYVIVRKPRAWKFSRDPRFKKGYEKVHGVSGFTIYAPR